MLAGSRAPDAVAAITAYSKQPTLRRGSATAGLLGLRVRIPPGAWVSVSSRCCVLPGRGLCDGLITRPEEFYRMLLCVCVIVKPR